jgi:hypothetical protein
LTETPVALDILVRPGVEFKPIEGHALRADPKLGQAGADLRIEAIAVHADVERRIAQPHQPG